MSFKIVSDSSSNIFSVEGVDFESVPLKIISSEKEYTDAPGLDTEMMIEDLKRLSAPSRTSCPNTSEWLDAFRGSDNIFAITITSNLSGSYSSCVNAANEYMQENKNAKVIVLDSLSAGPELALVIEKAASLIQSGATIEELDKAVREYAKNTHLVFSLKSLSNLAKNGRVNPAVAKLAGILGILVVGKASDEGTLQQLSKCHGEKKSFKSIISVMKDNSYRGGKVIIDHCLNLEAAKQLKSMILEEFKNADVRIGVTTGLCSFYAEKGGLMIGFEG
ncbi:MAG: DegV family protein [Clostridia bacterium]|nr:DegV family protein [Clostridia bacterium]